MESFDDNDIFINQFLIESEEHIINIENILLDLEKNLDSFESEQINSLFRSIHTIKGLSGMLEFNNLFEFSHSWETLLDNVRKKTQELNLEIINISFESLDLLSKIIESIKQTKKDDIPISDVTNKLKILIGEEISKNTEKISVNKEKEHSVFSEISSIFINNLSNTDNEKIINELQAGKSLFEIKIFLNKDCFSKDISYFSICINLEMLGEIIMLLPNLNNIPDIQEFNPSIFDLEIDILFSSDESLDRIYSMIKNKDIYVKKIYPKEISLNQDKYLELKEQNTDKDDDSTRKIDKKVKNTQTNAHDTIRVDTTKLDTLLTLMGEQVISKTQLEHISNSLTKLVNEKDKNLIDMEELLELSRNLNEKLSTFSRLNSELQENVMRIRMLPIGTVFNRFSRIVRDLSKEMGKKVELIIEGEDTELDKTIIEEISDPIMHIIRNAIDHGLESPNERLSIGKIETGIIKLNAYQQGNGIVITIQDDGKGLNLEKIKNKAIEKGIINKDSKLSESQIVNLIFEAGFSTADEVTGISGRGVGMDVVKKNISNLKGTIEIETKENKGTKFVLKLPLTLAIIQSLIVNIGNRNFALPLSTVVESYRAIPDEVKILDGKPVIKLREEVLPILHFEDYFMLSKINENSKYYYVVIIGVAEKKFAFIVNKLIGQQEIVIKPINDPFVKIPGIAGATLLGDTVTLIIEPSNVVKGLLKL
ncbi:MAG: chemotaxis protein CheA [Candidatus Sericytochromatia bacterium]